MGKRVYLGELLAAMSYSPAMPEYGYHKPKYRLQMIYDAHDFGHDKHTRSHEPFEGETWQEVIAKVKAFGFQVWGKDPLDYYAPHTAIEQIMLEEIEKYREGKG
jgi:aspartyl-tRNA synthetase